MQRKHFDILLSVGGLVLAVLLTVFGMYFYGRYDFAQGTVEDNLKAQKITFTAEEFLSDEEKESDDLVKYAGEAVDDGKKAEIYANDYIGLHLQTMGGEDNPELNGLTYSELGALARAEDITDEERETINGVRDTVFRGETLRGLLLTTYGFWQFGQEARMAMIVSFLGAIFFLVLAILGFVHAFRTPKDATI